MRYVYSVIRFVPEPARGEFINIGVVAGRHDGQEWHLKHVTNFQRALSAGSKMAFQTARFDLERLDASVSVDVPVPVDILDSLVASWRSVLQLSEPAPISASSASEACERIFSLMVVDPERSHRTTASAARKALKAAYGGEIPGQDQTIFDRVKAVVEGQTAQFDFAVANGHLVQLAKAWSFDVRAIDAATTGVRAWGYAVGLIRDQRHKTSLSAAAGRTYDVPDDVDIAAIYVPPSTPRGEEALSRSLEVFRTLEVDAVPISRAHDVAKRAAQALTA